MYDSELDPYFKEFSELGNLVVQTQFDESGRPDWPKTIYKFNDFNDKETVLNKIDEVMGKLE